MVERFVDRESLYPNRYKITRGDGTVEYVTIERADEPTVAGTPLNAETLNKIIDALSAFDTDEVIPVDRGGTGATDGSTGLKNLLAAGPMILKEGADYHYGDSLPDPGTPGRIFFKKVSE